MINITILRERYPKVELIVNVREDITDINTNTSQMHGVITLKVSGGNFYHSPGYSRFNATGLGERGLNVAGSYNTGEYVLGDFTWTIAHDNNTGEAGCAATAIIASNLIEGSCFVNFNLTTIPRASTVNFECEKPYLVGSNLKFKIDRKLPNCREEMMIVIKDKNDEPHFLKTLEFTNNLEYELTIEDTDFILNSEKNNKTCILEAGVITYNANNEIVGDIRKNTLVCHFDDYAPLAEVNVFEQNEKINKLFENSIDAKLFINHSIAFMSVSAMPNGGATIASAAIMGKDGQVLKNVNPNGDNYEHNVVEHSFPYLKVVDSRGFEVIPRAKQNIENIQIYEYPNPVIQEISLSRPEQTSNELVLDKLKIFIELQLFEKINPPEAYTPGISSNSVKNFKISYKEINDANYTYLNVTPQWEYVFNENQAYIKKPLSLGNIFDFTKRYFVKIEIEDGLVKLTKTIEIQPGIETMSIGRDYIASQKFYEINAETGGYKRLNCGYAEDVLYQSENGTVGDLLLTKPLDDYDYIKIIHSVNKTAEFYGLRNGSFFNLENIYNNENPQYVRFKYLIMSNYKVEGLTIRRLNGNNIVFDGVTPYEWDSNWSNISIHKVIGFKK